MLAYNKKILDQPNKNSYKIRIITLSNLIKLISDVRYTSLILLKITDVCFFIEWFVMMNPRSSSACLFAYFISLIC
jgi:hypothetical protein